MRIDIIYDKYDCLFSTIFTIDIEKHAALIIFSVKIEILCFLIKMNRNKRI